MSEPLNESEARVFISNEVDKILTNRLKQAVIIVGAVNLLAVFALFASVKSAAKTAAEAAATKEVESQRKQLESIVTVAIEQSLQVARESQAMLLEIGRTAIALEASQVSASNISSEVAALSIQTKEMRDRIAKLQTDEIISLMNDLTVIANEKSSTEIINVVYDISTRLNEFTNTLKAEYSDYTSRVSKLSSNVTNLSEAIKLSFNHMTQTFARINATLSDHNRQLEINSVVFTHMLWPMYNVHTQMYYDSRGNLKLPLNFKSKID